MVFFSVKTVGFHEIHIFHILFVKVDGTKSAVFKRERVCYTGIAQEEVRNMFIKNQEYLPVTAVTNRFIDEYMPEANGEFVKIYLFLLRLSGQADADIQVAAIADRFNHTEADVMRALRYWEKQGLLAMEKEGDRITAIRLLPVGEKNLAVEETEPPVEAETEATEASTARTPVTEAAAAPKEPVQIYVSENSLNQLQTDMDFKQVLFVAETYLGRTLSVKDVQLFAYLYDQLHFSEDLLEYLVEYCVSKEHRSCRYIESVALAWHQDGIRTVEQAKEMNRAYNRENRQIMQAFGISGRILTRDERKFVEKWLGEYAMPLAVVVEACGRTMSAIHQPSFEYTDKIIFAWKQAGVHTVEEARAHQENRRLGRKAAASAEKKDTGSRRYQNYRGRDVDYDALIAQGGLDSFRNNRVASEG